MNPTFFQRNHRLLFYGVWFLLGLVQAGLTELQDDEAYYWVYSRFLDWGYFDHPPMIAVLIKMGYAIFPNELGVRLFPLLLNILSLVIIERLIDKKNALIFYTIALSIAVLQLTGFVAVPDIPLIFFTALFFLCYKRFVVHSNILNSFLLGLAIALLLYSKYHAVLIVLFVVFSNPRLLLRFPAWIAAFTALLLFGPHLWWQYQHDWVSFRYHLFESNINAYKPSYTLEYIVGQLLLPGPIAGFILLPAALMYKPVRQENNYLLERALRFTLIGVYVFFLLSSFRGKVEANWTSPVLVPLIVLAHQFLKQRAKWFTALYKLLPVTLLLVVFARIVMIADILPVKAVRQRYHAWKDWPAGMKERTLRLPIVFSNSYQRASKYWFYSGQVTYSQNWYRERRNNYNFWPIEDSLLGKPVYFLDKFLLSRFPDSLQTPVGWIGFRHDTSFVSYAKVSIRAPKEISAQAGAAFSIPIKVELPPYYRDFINSRNEESGDTIRIGVFGKKGWVRDLYPAITLKQLISKPDHNLAIDPQLPKGDYILRFSISHTFYNPTHNSDKIRMQVR